jgi:mobilome CxxCx(11)CxxC protein
MNIEQSERRSCNESAERCFGTAYIFEQRARPLRNALKVLSFSSLAGPLSIGILVVAVGTESGMLPYAIFTASVLSALQVIVSLWSLTSKWQENFTYYIESKADNYYLADKFQSLAKKTVGTEAEWRQGSELLETLGGLRSKTDYQHDISDEEKRMGMKASLRNFQRECVGCKSTPTSMEPSDCTVCGDYKKRVIKWLM